jgi:transcriptional regulator with XRE-family HTH domain
MFENVEPTLRFLRELKELSQKELAERARVGKSQLSKYENGRELPKLDSLERILNELGADFELFAATLAFGDRYAALLKARRLPLRSSSRLPVLPGVGSWLGKAIDSVSSARDDLVNLHEAAWVVALAQPFRRGNGKDCDGEDEGKG